MESAPMYLYNKIVERNEATNQNKLGKKSSLTYLSFVIS